MKGDHLFLTNSFEGVYRDIDILKKEYKKVVMFGVDKMLSECIRFESVAQKDGRVILLFCTLDDAPLVRLNDGVSA